MILRVKILRDNMVLPFLRKHSVSGIVYEASWGQTSGEVVIVTGRGFEFTIPYERFLEVRDTLLQSDVGISVVRGAGAGLLTLGVAGIAMTARPIVSAEVDYRLGQAANSIAVQVQNQAYNEAIRKSEESAAQIEYTRKFAQELGIENTDFYVYIPKIDARAPVVSNVDTAREDTYLDALKKGVAHAYGSSLPGRDGGTYVFAHSTNGAWNVSRYNAVFYLLRELNPEDQDDIFVFFQGKVHKYKVAEKHIVDGDDVSWLESSQSGPERLILQTCWPPGTAWKRLIIVAYPEKIDTENAATPLGQTPDVYGGN